MSQRFFPIQTATACALKWSWSTLYLYDGSTASCHRTGWGKLTAHDFDKFHNTDKKIQERQAMLEGKWPDQSCSYCKNIEEIGGFSDRQLHLSIPDLYPHELDHNPTEVKILPTILEVYLNNTCNLACLYCLPTLSSKINSENKKFGRFVHNDIDLHGVDVSDHQQLLAKFWIWMHNYSGHLKRLNVLGGEPFYQNEFYNLLDYFDQNPHPNLELCIVTNLMTSTDKLDGICLNLQQLLAKRKLKRVDITCSIDCWGKEQEYVRYGLDLDKWIQNFELLLSKKWIKLNINQTISVLTIKTMPDLLAELQKWQQIRPVGHFFSEVTPQPAYMAPHILGGEVFDRDFECILNLMPESDAKRYMTGIADRVRLSQPDRERANSLRIFLEEKDRRRQTNWRNTFPWLETALAKADINA